MFCSRCGATIEPSYKYCPECGCANPSDPLNANQAEAPQTFDQTIPLLVSKKPMPLWFKILTGIAVLALIGVTAGILFTVKLSDVVDKQLETLKSGEIEKAYKEYTSKDFKLSTTFDQFKNFIEAYPVFQTNQSTHFSQRSIDHNTAILKGYLSSQDHLNTPIEYRLVKENGRWKILSIRLLKPEEVQNSQDAGNSSHLIEIAKEQLKEIQEQKISEAYHNFSSREFKEATSEDNFREFIKRYPVLSTHHVVSFHKPTIRNGVGTLSVIVQSDQIAAYIKYYLIFEDNNWKIWSMRILSPSENSNREIISTFSNIQDQMEIGEIILGEEVNEEGLVKNSSLNFLPHLKDLLVDIEIKNGRKGNVIFLNLKHQETGTTVTAQVEIEENGDSILMSAFSTPTNGWPIGKYTLSITSSSGLKRVIEFDIN